ncbi:hypothetical protein VE03_03540 [Pseudogymnoascus sp. 23342-1-I1]|nr:hypothetical protein VE03_03540 [Pseudogymnoascus sp. 23342-1-I1]
MMVRAKGPARSARQSQGTATSTVMLAPNPTQTVVRVNQAQSLHIVQTTVSATLNTILWINNLFPDNYFEARRYSLNDPAFPYSVRTPAQIALETKQQGSDKASVTWHFLVRGKTAKADKIWSWLDGVCDALKHGYLASFQITFHSGDVSRDTIAVAYVMKFNYSEKGSKIQIDVSSGNQRVEITAEDMQDLKNMFQRLMKISRESDKIPEDPTICLQLTYNETCPDKYEPRGFVVAPDPSIIMNQDGFTIGAVDTGYHSVGMSLVTPAETAVHGSNGSFGVPTRPNSQQIFKWNNLISTPAPASPCLGSSVLNTQDRVDRQLIREMVPLGREVGDTQRVQDTQSQATGAKESPSPTLPHGPVEKNTPPLEERSFYFDHEAIRDLYPDHKWRNEQVQISFAEEKDIDCPCSKKFAGMTVQCELCQKRQHLQCHGYLETDVMDTHLCYKCLLRSEPNLSKEMQQLCLLRQVAWVSSMEMYPLKESDLAKRIDCKVKELIPLSQRLAKDKYLRKISRPQSKRHKEYHRRSEIPPYEFIVEERGRLLKEYLNPTFKIEKYLHEHLQTSGDKSQLSQPPPPTLPTPRMSSMAPEPAKLVPATHVPETPRHVRADIDDGGFIYGIFDDIEEDTATPHTGPAESSMDASTQGVPSDMGSPGPQPSLGVKRKADVLERGMGNVKRPSWVNSPFVLGTRLYE